MDTNVPDPRATSKAPSRGSLADKLFLVHVGVMTVAIAIAASLLGAGCQKKTEAPVKPPTDVMIAAMRDYCKIGDMPVDKRREAMKLWAWHHASSTEMGPLWTRAVKKDPSSIATVLAAAEAAVGKGNCPVLAPLTN